MNKFNLFQYKKAIIELKPVRYLWLGSNQCVLCKKLSLIKETDLLKIHKSNCIALDAQKDNL